ncbi:hypothetical protein [Paramaledivibacter caminithermalis]|jgi:hypothetical protein|uniref:Uncharacterized protein n=1 Tax=Paramaledivibacter caminithermalis (strain DSM 15212 / CIP 107654 / DViRD3) TaxID=1121301 RepID=A0A1M6K520_PARC5|nr:hypothetical protein [Paramaledivibacter caminithermalis]SHJ54041.1 hypothetical protein SAMN02745912_00265 [Paramaledivibacter caminithermalis DSM 15212]
MITTEQKFEVCEAILEFAEKKGIEYEDAVDMFMEVLNYESGDRR